MDGAKLGAGKESIQMLIPVPRQDGNPIMRAYPLTFEPVSQLIRAPVGLAIGQAPFRVFPRIDKSQFVWAIQLTPCQVITDIHTLLHSVSLISRQPAPHRSSHANATTAGTKQDHITRFRAFALGNGIIQGHCHARRARITPFIHHPMRLFDRLFD